VFDTGPSISSEENEVLRIRLQILANSYTLVEYLRVKIGLSGSLNVAPLG
jgi:hypothetical protein